MQFDFDEDQYAFADSIRAFLQQRFPAATLRAQWESDDPQPRAVWAQLAESGLTAVAADESVGGGSAIDLALPLEELGYAGVPDVFALAAGAIVPFLTAHAPDSDWLAGIVEGETIPAVRLRDQRLVVGGQDADVFLVEDVDGSVSLIPRAELAVRPRATQDPTLRIAEIGGTGGGESITVEPAGSDALRTGVRAVIASTLVGNAQRQVEMTRDYTLVREQFGSKIASFQAIKHRLANALVKVEAARSLAWWAHHSRTRDEASLAAEAAAMAKDAAGDAAFTAGHAALQLHGGIGFTWEYDLHLWLQRGTALTSLFGASDALRIELGDRFIADVEAAV